MTTETISRPAPKPLAMATINTVSGTVAVPCERVGEFLAITPGFYMDSEGNSILEGTFNITHLPTGREITSSSGCIECARKSAKTMNALGIDWSALPGTTPEENAGWVATLTAEQKEQLHLVMNLDWLCDAEYCDDEDEPEPAKAQG